MMLQTTSPDQLPVPPEPPPIPDIPTDVFDPGPLIMASDDMAKIAFFVVAGLVVITWLIVRGPIGHAIGDVIKRWLGGGSAKELPAEIDGIARRLEHIEHQLGELAERQDFSERMLAQVRRDKALPGAEDVQR